MGCTKGAAMIVEYGRARRNGLQHGLATAKVCAEPPESTSPKDGVIDRGREMLDLVCQAAGLANANAYNPQPRRLVLSWDTPEPNKLQRQAERRPQ